MRVRVSYTVDVDDEYRRAIRLYYGKPGLATREEVVAWLEATQSWRNATYPSTSGVANQEGK